MSGKYDVVVIGAGPGGYVAAIKAAKLGLKTAIIEERRAGGTCLNRGCIPAKAMIHASSLYREMQEAERFGISASDVTYDYGKIVAYREETTDKLVQGVEQLLKANGVDVYEGKGTLLEEKKVRIRKEQEDVVLEGENIILASGSKPLILPIPGIDSERCTLCDERSSEESDHYRRRCYQCGICHSIREPWMQDYNPGSNAKVSTEYG